MRTLEEITAEARTAQTTEDLPTMRRLAEELSAHTSQSADARRLFLLGTIARSEAQYPLALQHYHDALSLYRNLNDENGCAASLLNIGIVHWYTGSYPSALSAFHQSLALREREGNKVSCARLMANIALCYMSVRDFDRALEHLKNAHEILVAHGDVGGVASTAGNIGSVYANLQDFPSALQWYHRALELNTEIGNTHAADYTRTCLANSYLVMEDWEAARSIMRELHPDETTLPSTTVLFLINTAFLQRHDGDVSAARQSLQSALEHSKRFGLRGEEASCYKELRDLAEHVGSLPEYVAFNNAHVSLTDEIKGQETARRLAMQEKERELEAQARAHERERTILFSTLPRHVAERVIRGEQVTDHYDDASVLFMDIVGFTSIAERLPATQVVQLLDAVFSLCDRVCSEHGLTKIKTTGDSYLAVAGLPQPCTDHASRAARAAIAVMDAFSREASHEVSREASHEVSREASREASHEVSREASREASHAVSHEVLLRVGLHCGPITAGVIGTERLQYDVWGDTVNVASRMESTCMPGRIQVSEAFAQALKGETAKGRKGETAFEVVERGTIEIKGKGPMTTYWLEGA